MKIIRMTANPSGAWPPIQEGAFNAIPEGHALVPDSLDLAAFYAAVGFVVPTFSEVGETDEMPAHMAMTGYTVAQEALDAWIASHPEPDPLETAKSAKLSGLSAACHFKGFFLKLSLHIHSAQWMICTEVLWENLHKQGTVCIFPATVIIAHSVYGRHIFFACCRNNISSGTHTECINASLV